ncbi:MAG: rod shape-determining protein MreC [Candidatus Omnitrophota bacterium]
MSGKRSKFIVYGLVLLTAFLLLFVRQDLLSPFKFSLVRFLNIPVRLIAYPVREVKKIVLYHRTYEEWKRLSRQNEMLRQRLASQDEILKENNRLAQLLKFQRRLVYSSAAANVIGRDPTRWNAAVILDRGLADGVDIGMPVVSALGVVGKVVEAGVDQSEAILVTDPGFAVVALDQRSREVGLVSGTLQGLCRMRYLSSDADVQVGDLIVTSKLSSSFPEGLLIGEVTDVHIHKNSPVVDCLIKPAASLSQIEEVLVILKK